MSYTRNAQFYDLIGQGLLAFGYTSLTEYVNDFFAEKYNAEASFAQMGFPLNPNIPIRPTFEQIEAVIRPYTMAANVDIDSDGPTKSTDGLTMKMGQLPTFKHEFSFGRKELRERAILAEERGAVSDVDIEVAMNLLFDNIDKLLGGNYNTFRYQRHQIVSTGKLVLDPKNNPYGVPLELDFGVPSKNKKTSKWYSKDGGGNVTEEAAIDPIKDLKAVIRNARQKDGAPKGHFEMSQTTWDDLMAMPFFRSQYAFVKYPTATQDAVSTLGSLAEEDAIKTWLEGVLKTKIEIIDHVAYVEKYDVSGKKIAYGEFESFDEGVIAYVPDGAIGDAQFGRPFVMESPLTRNALYDGGRTLLSHVYGNEGMKQTVKSEVTGLVVPNATRWMYYLTVKG